MLLTFHGLVEDAQGQQPVIVHVLTKAKRHANGSFLVRTVSYVERVALQSESAKLIYGAKVSGIYHAKSRFLVSAVCSLHA